MVVPDTYEAEKFARQEPKETQVSERLQDNKTVVRKVLTKDDLHRIKYERMFNEIDQLKDLSRGIETYRQVIEAANKRTNSARKKEVDPKEQSSGLDYNQSQESQMSLVSRCSRDKGTRNRANLRKSAVTMGGSTRAVPRLSSINSISATAAN